jgi:cell division initiation protein
MKVTPLEIRQKQFEKKTFGGLDKDEVQAYLNSLSVAWEKMTEEQASLRSRLENSEREVEKLRQVEASLYNTIKSAEEASQKRVEQANQHAHLIEQEARLKATSLMQEARRKAARAMEQSEEFSRRSYNEMVGQAKNLEMELRHIENLKDAFLSEIKLIARDLLEKSEKAEQRSARVEFSVPALPQSEIPELVMEEEDSETFEVQVHADGLSEGAGNETAEIVVEAAPPAEELAHPAEPLEKAAEKKQDDDEGSFFDRIG